MVTAVSWSLPRNEVTYGTPSGVANVGHGPGGQIAVGAGHGGAAGARRSRLVRASAKAQPMVWLGEISYEIFLIHVIVMEIAMVSVLRWRVYTGSMLVLFVLTLNAFGPEEGQELTDMHQPVVTPTLNSPDRRDER
jgi:peptidoglycan/LPS O-acetylase OafA/YrhL